MEVLPGSGTKEKSDLTAPAGWRQEDRNPVRKEYPQVSREHTPLEPPSRSWEGSVGAGSVGVDRGRGKSPGSYSERPWGRLVNPLAGNPSSSLVVITSDSDSKGPWIEPRLRQFPQRTGNMEVLPGSGTNKKSDLTVPSG